MHNPHTARLAEADEARAAEVAKRLADEATKRKAEFRDRLRFAVWNAEIQAPAGQSTSTLVDAVMRFLEDEVRR